MVGHPQAHIRYRSLVVGQLDGPLLQPGHRLTLTYAEKVPDSDIAVQPPHV